MKKKTILAVLFLLAAALLSACSVKVTVDEGINTEKFDQYLNPEAFITPETLKQLMADEEQNLVVIGVLDPAKALIPGNISGSAIVGSYTVWRPDYSGAGSVESISAAIGGYRKAVEEMEVLLSKAGATPESTLVIYAADAHHDAARLLWQIKSLGHTDVRYLDGGLNGWIGAGYPTASPVSLVAEPIKTDYRAVEYRISQMDADIEQLINALENPEEWVVIDSRSLDEYDGKQTGSSRGAFGSGRIHGTVHIDWANALNSTDTLLRTLEELNAIYGDVIDGKKVIVFCQSGVRSAHTWLVLTYGLGAKNVYNYDGSWIEWSFAASSASAGQLDEELRAKVLSLTEEWSDNGGAIN